MTSKEALRLLVDGFIGYEKARKEVNKNYCDIVNLLIKDLETLEKLEAKTHLLFKDRKTISKEFDKWCVDNNVLNCSENMVTWFLTIKLKEWLENEDVIKNI